MTDQLVAAEPANLKKEVTKSHFICTKQIGERSGFNLHECAVEYYNGGGVLNLVFFGFDFGSNSI